MIACVDCSYYRATDPTASDLCTNDACATDVPDYVRGTWSKTYLGVSAARDSSGPCMPNAVLFERRRAARAYPPA